MKTPVRGQVLRVSTEGSFRDVGRVVLVLSDAQAFWYVPFPAAPKQREVDAPPSRRQGVAFDIGCPRRVRFQELQNSHFFVDYVPPVHWLLSEEELASGVLNSDVVGSRANLRAWFARREHHKQVIAEIVDNLDAFELLELGRLNEEVREQAKKKATSPRQVRRLLRLHLFGCDHRNALLPRLAFNGRPGQPKYSAKKAGRPRDPVARGTSTEVGYICTAEDRLKLLQGWRKYKKAGVSVMESWLLTSAQYWPGSSSEKHRSKHYLLAPRLERPSLQQFKAEAKRAKESASRINMGERVHNLSERAMRGSAKDGVSAVGQVMLIDSTSEDQTPVSEVSSLVVLPSTWRTVVFDVRTEYIFGLHCGFESPSTLTSLMAILNAASPKEEFCRRYGIELGAGEWHARMPKRVRADNGELKSISGIGTLNQAETSLEFTSSYDAAKKGELEASHKSLHARVDHKNAGSTKGRRRARGEPSRDSDACRTFRMNMPHVIRAILRHNNEEPVPKLLTLEMRQDGVQPTRRAIMEWLTAKGYVATEPADLTSLRTQCLPRLRAVIDRDGIHLFDPRHPQRRIKGLVYRSTWLTESGLCDRSRGVRTVEVMLDPNDLSHCHFVRAGQLRRVDLCSKDVEAKDLTLCEHLHMHDADRDIVEPLQQALEEADACRALENRATNSSARKAKKLEKAAAPPPSAGQSTVNGKREARRTEIRREQLLRMGIDPDATASSCQPETHERASEPAADSHSATESLMRQLRSASRRPRSHDEL